MVVCVGEEESERHRETQRERKQAWEAQMKRAALGSSVRSERNERVGGVRGVRE